MEETLYIKEFGPVAEAFVPIRKVTVLIGRQGSGKSTIAKLYSVFSWMEKSLMRHSMTEKYVSQYARFQKKYCTYNGIDSYFTSATVLRFSGFHYSFEYENNELHIQEEQGGNNDFAISKVMYVPAERSILGCVDHPSQLKGLGAPMETFADEYAKAKAALKGGYTLPFEDVSFEYDQLNDMAKLRLANGEVVKLSAGSSGFQSSLPLLLVSRNLTEMVRSSEDSELSDKERKAMQKDVESVMADPLLSENVKIASLRSISSRYRYSRLVNIVEEMELNLFPDSQKGVLHELVANVRTLPENRLMLTTHSPYVINYLTLSIKAEMLLRRAMAAGRADLVDRLHEVVPRPSCIASDEVAVYELEGGKATELERYDGIPSDNNFLNVRLNDTNLDFDALLEIEDDLGE